MSRLAYLDTSALVKLVVREEETDALRAEIDQRPSLVASRLARLEARRAVARKPVEGAAATLADVLGVMTWIDITVAILDQAAEVAPPALRSVDAIHLATALSLADADVDVITYDERLADAARAHGLTVVQPGRPSQA